jgi:NADH-quinone oxidoreductase subunit L
VGDSAFLAAIAFIFYLFKSLNFGIVFSLISFILNEKFVFLFFSFYYIEVIAFFLFLAAVGKSAQLGLHG